MAQELTNRDDKPLSPNEQINFARQREALHQFRAFRFAIGDGDDAARGEIILCALDAQRLPIVVDFCRRALAPMPRKVAQMVASHIAAVYPLDKFTDPGAFLEMLTATLETIPAIAGQAMVDPRNPESLVRTQKFTPSLAEVSEWCAAYMRPIQADLRQAEKFIAESQRLERLKLEPGFKMIEAGK